MAETERGQPGQTPGGGWVPVPDPTALTTEAVARATAQYRRELVNLRELVEQRMDAIDARYETHLRETVGLRHQLEEKVIHLGEICEEKFDGIDRRFADRDARARDNAESGEKALAAALESARQLSELQNRANKELNEAQDRANSEAISKAQAATNEQIRALDQAAAISRRALEDKIDDARTRLTSIEERTRGIKEAGGEAREVRGEQRLSQNAILSIVVALVIATGVVVSIIALVHK